MNPITNELYEYVLGCVELAKLKAEISKLDNKLDCIDAEIENTCNDLLEKIDLQCWNYNRLKQIDLQLAALELEKKLILLEKKELTRD